MPPPKSEGRAQGMLPPIGEGKIGRISLGVVHLQNGTLLALSAGMSDVTLLTLRYGSSFADRDLRVHRVRLDGHKGFPQALTVR